MQQRACAEAVQFTTKAKAAEATEAEQIMQEAMEIAVLLGGVSAVTRSLGKVFTRIGLKLTGKEKSGREKTIYSFECPF